MSFSSHLERLRNKPEHVRKHIAFWSSLGVTAIIFSFWVGSFTFFGDKTPASVAQAVKKTNPPVQSLVASAGSFFSGIQNWFFAPQRVEYKNTIEVLPGSH